MKKLICALLAVVMMLPTVAFGAVDVSAKPLRFTPVGGGKYIYCNNFEFIRRKDLADNSNQYAKYIMNNTLEPDNYAMFVSHVNHTELRDSAGNITEPGFDIEVDVYFKAEEDTQIVITALGFEVPDHSRDYYEGVEYNTEEAWGCMNAWADYLKVPIREIDSDRSYIPREFEDINIDLKAGESFWLSEYIPNYRAVPFYRPVHILADFTVVSGKTCANVAAVRSTGALRDRSTVHPNPAFGYYDREKQYKGIADTLNRLETSLEYTVADWTGGMEFPVTVYNEFVPEGNTITHWYTHINPYADIWNKQNAVASDMLEFRYEDDSKLKYYGSKVPQDQRDNVWVFGSNRGDYAAYPGRKSGYSSSDYVPNRILGTDAVSEEACNLGNYGVSLDYKITITNEGKITRYALYNLATVSNNIVMLLDAEGKPMNGYALCKGEHTNKEADTMACVELPGGTTTTFTVRVILPTNYAGGMENSLKLVNDKVVPRSYTTTMQKVPKDLSYTGREFIKWDKCKLYKSYDKENWEEVNISPEFEKALHGSWNQYEFLYTDGGYMVKPALYDSKPYYVVREFFKTVYFLNDDFSLKSSHTLYQYPTDMSYADGTYYITAGSKYKSEDGEKWELTDGSFLLPVDNGGVFSCYRSGKDYYYNGGDGFSLSAFEGEAPLFIEQAGHVYYYVKNNTAFVSADGMYFTPYKTSSGVESIATVNDRLIINGVNYALPLADAVYVKLDGTYAVFENKPYIENDRVYVPYGYLSKLTGGTLNDSKLVLRNGEAYAPVRDFCDANGYEVSYDAVKKCVNITTK